MWLYQLSHDIYPLEQYRLDVWQDQVLEWPTGRVMTTDGARPTPGDSVVLWYAKKHAEEPGIVGWGIVLDFRPPSALNDEDTLAWRPVFPSDALKMHPLYSADLQEVVERIRGPMPQGTMWQVEQPEAHTLALAIRSWCNPT